MSPEEYKIWIFWEILPELFLYSAHSGSTVDTCRLQSTRLLEEFLTFIVWWTPGDDFMFVSVFSAQLGSTADTCGASVYEAFWKNFGVVQAVQKTVKIPHAFLDMVVDKCRMVETVHKLWSLRSWCCPFCLC